MANGPSLLPAAAIRTPRCGCPTAGIGCSASGLRRRSTGAATGPPSRSVESATSIAPLRSRTSASSKRTRLPAGRASGCRPRPSGRASPHRPTPTSATSSTAPERQCRGRRATFSATSGNGPGAPSSPTRDSPRRPARSANITASSCPAGSLSSRERAAPLRAATAAPPTATFSRPALAGSSPAFASPAMADAPADRQAQAFRDDVLAGLASPIPAIPARWLYDRTGSELFDAITRLPSYYPTRTETALLQSIMPEAAARIPKGTAVVEFGAGSATKTPMLLSAIAPAAYVPVDISGSYLKDSAAEVSGHFPNLPVIPVIADFVRPFDLPQAVAGLPRLGFFPGSTIGNFVPRSATDLLRHFRELLGTGAQLLIGMDRVKPVERLIAAYDDSEGLTARFNLNLLERINRELDGTIPLDAFLHEARWNDILSRIEMHLVATGDVEFTVCGVAFEFKAGASIHSENSHKYGRRGARVLLLAGGWTPIAEWSDPAGDWALVLAEAQPNRFAP